MRIKSIFKSILFSIGPFALAGQSVMPLNGPFTEGQAMQFAYSGGTGSPTDWIGIYRQGQTPGQVASTAWQYVPATSGTATFAGTLTPGTYNIHLFCCDGYQILASHNNFKVEATRLRSRLSFYKTTDTLRFSISSVASGDRLAVFRAEDFANGAVLPGAVPVLEKTFNGFAPMLKVDLLPSPPPGQYVGVFLSAANAVLSFVQMEVKSPPVWPSTVTKIGLASCGNQGAAQPALEHVLAKGIDAFLLLGDNTYIDTYSEAVLRTTYENWLTGRSEFQRLRASVPLVATWDDHDYGCCDEDADYPLKVQSQKIMLDFFEEPANSPRRTQSGIYTQYQIGPAGERLQIIVLDSRYFLDDKRPNNGCGVNDYCPWAGPGDASKTILGSTQWQWLKNALLEPADLRIVMSSVQFGASYNGWEGWSLFPYERKRMQDLIQETQAEHVFFVSGDIHYSEVSRLDGAASGQYPLYDFTASAINQSWPPEPNQNRVGNLSYGDPNVGLIEIDWAARAFTCSVWDAANQQRFAHTVSFNDLEFDTNATGTPPQVRTFSIRQIPSPGEGSARLVLSEIGDGVVSLFDSSGQLVRQQTLRKEEVLEFLQLSPGIYRAEFRQSDGKKVQTSVVVIRP